MFEKSLVENCAPTLAGIKTGSIFSINTINSDINREIRRLNAVFTKRGLRLVPIDKKNNRTMMYLYRPDKLKEDLKNPDAKLILCDKGYSCTSPECCLAQLVKHLRIDKEFPHEIGLFLGYPPLDFKGF
ncbi:Protein of unknown function [Lachnospiraceae bacterium RM5]|nr:Protein of unknown function [Lachnospiraceae bacterium RM5]